MSRPILAQIGNLAVLLTGAVFVLGAATALDLGTPRRLGPGAFPLLVGLCVMALALVSIITDLRKPYPPEAGNPAAIGAVAAAMTAFALLSPLAGVVPATFAASALASLAAARRGWIWRIALAALISAGTWFLFIYLLQVPFVALRGF